MRKLVFISLLSIIGYGCEETPQINFNPNYVANWQGDVNADYAWRYQIEKRIQKQFTTRGLFETNESPDVIAYGIFGTWTNEDDFYLVEKRGLKRIDPNNFIPSYDMFYGKIEFGPKYRKAGWAFFWSFTEPNEIPILAEDLLKFYLDEIHKKNGLKNSYRAQNKEINPKNN